MRNAPEWRDCDEGLRGPGQTVPFCAPRGRKRVGKREAREAVLFVRARNRAFNCSGGEDAK